MAESASAGAAHDLVVEAYGARLAVGAPDADTLARVVAGLPLGWEACAPEDTDPVGVRIAVSRHREMRYAIREEAIVAGAGNDSSAGAPPVARVTPCQDLELAIRVVRRRIRRHIGHHARGWVFVEAGVVAHRGRAIVLPGSSLTGKSTLVAALVRAGAAYYSDDYAVLDEDGLVSSYREPLAMRDRTGELTAETLVGTSGEDRVPIGVLALTSYTPGAQWNPQPHSMGRGVVALMQHALAPERPAETLATARRALEGASVLEGPRGEAEMTAIALLEATDS